MTLKKTQIDPRLDLHWNDWEGLRPEAKLTLERLRETKNRGQTHTGTTGRDKDPRPNLNYERLRERKI